MNFHGFDLVSLRISGIAHRGTLPAKRGPQTERADRGRSADAQQRPSQPDGNRERPGGLEPQGAGPRAGRRFDQVTSPRRRRWAGLNPLRALTRQSVPVCRRQVNWREAKGEEEINVYQSERRRRTLHSLPKESRVR